jgi:two-component system sensor histidine kinase/response regulator
LDLQLLDNAIKYTHQGSITIKVSRHDTKYTHISNYLFEIEDSGKGIAEADLSRVFLPFNQVHHTNNRKSDGAGLGLSISKKIVEALEGNIGVKSTLGVGSTFWFEIPLQPLPPFTISPDLHRIPLDEPDALYSLSRYFGCSTKLSSVPRLVIGTNMREEGANRSMWKYLRLWGIEVEVVKSEQGLDSFLRRKNPFFILDPEPAFLSKIKAKGISAVLFSSLSNVSMAMRTAEAFSSTLRVTVLTMPIEPLQLCRAILFLVGYDECAQKITPQAPQAPQAPTTITFSPQPSTATSTELFSSVIDVLVVEDNVVAQLVIKKVLEQCGVRFCVTPSGDEALEIWRTSQTTVPLIFMDVEIEGQLNGLEVTRAIRGSEKRRDQSREEAGLPPGSRSFVAVMTGRAMASDQAEAEQSGCDTFLTKPVDLNVIRHLVETLLKSQQPL